MQNGSGEEQPRKIMPGFCAFSIILLGKSYQFISMEAWNVKMETKKLLHNGKNKQLAGCLTIKVVERGWEREKGGIKMFETENIFHSTRETQLFPLPPTRMSNSCEEI